VGRSGGRSVGRSDARSGGRSVGRSEGRSVGRSVGRSEGRTNRGIPQEVCMTPERIHVVPVNDLKDHVASADCWCKPTEEEGWPDVWAHHSMDQREEYENGREKS
jgi:hypothetical protein